MCSSDLVKSQIHAGGRGKGTVYADAAMTSKVMDGGGQTLGYYRDNTVFINQDIAGQGALQTGWHNLTQQLLTTAMEEVVHHVTGAVDFSRDLQDFILNLSVYMAKEISGIS